MTTAKKLGVTKLSSRSPALKNSIVLLRGLGRTSAFWLDFPRYLSEKANVVMVDLPGGGQSPSYLGRGSIEALAGDVLYTLEQEGLLGSHLLGISLGGMVAATTAARLENRQRLNGNCGLTSLIVINSSARFTKQKRIAPLALMRMLWQFIKPRLSHRTFIEYLISKNYLQHHSQLAEIWDGLWRAEKIRRLPVLRQLLGAAKFWGERIYTRLNTPTLFLASQQDQLVSWLNSVVMWQTVPQAQLKTYADFGHDLPTEDPAQVAKDVVKFCLECEATMHAQTDALNPLTNANI